MNTIIGIAIFMAVMMALYLIVEWIGHKEDQKKRITRRAYGHVRSVILEKLVSFNRQSKILVYITDERVPQCISFRDSFSQENHVYVTDKSIEPQIRRMAKIYNLACKYEDRPMTNHWPRM